MKNNKHHLRLRSFLRLCLISLQLLAVNVYAIAYCAIREPVSIIQEFFPSYTSYQTMEGNIDESVRQEILGTLPESHFQEIGTHSLYVVYKGKLLIGFVHARTEKGVFGLDEIIWVMNPDMTMRTFRYQKNRSGSLSQGQMQKLATILTASDLTDLIDARENADLNKRDEVIIMSAIKALFVTKALWPDAENF
jgi:hypothetical protein